MRNILNVTLEFSQKWDLGHSKPCMINVYLHIKFETNIFIKDQNIAKNPNLR